MRYKNAFKSLPQKDIRVFVLNIGYGTTLRTYEPFWLWLATSRHLAARKEGKKEPYMHHIDAYSDKLLLSIRYNPTRDFPFK